MTDSLDSLSPAWRKTLDAIERRQSSPVMLPLAIGAIVDIFEAGTNDGATIRFEDYEQRFRALAAKHQITLKSGPWMPYLALTGSSAVLVPLDPESGGPRELCRPRPKSRAALLGQSSCSHVSTSLAQGLANATVRHALSAWLEARLDRAQP